MILNKNKYLTIFILICLMLNIPAYAETPAFIENKGQWPSEVLFRAEFPGYQAWITKKGLVMNLFRIMEEIQSNEPLALRKKNSVHVQGDAVFFLNAGSNADHVIPLGKIKKSTVYNFFISGKRINDVPAYEEVWVRNVYPGIDQRWYADEGHLRFDYVVQRGANYNNIQILTDEFTRVNIKGNIAELQTRFGPMQMMKLHCFQDGKELISHLISENGKIMFEIHGYDKNKDLIIDPVLFATYLGGSSSDMNPIVRCDGNNDIIVACNTLSMDFPVSPGSYDMSYNGNNDICISKLNAAGNTLLFSTFLGGSNYDAVTDMEITSNNEILFCGNTESSDFPITTGCLDNVFSGLSEGILCKLNAAGDFLQHSTFIGGSQSDFVSCMVLDNMNNVYIAGQTESADFITTPGAYDQTFNGNEDIFVMKINNSWSNFDFSTFVGGSFTSEYAFDIEWGNNQVYVCGICIPDPNNSYDFPFTANAVTENNLACLNYFMTNGRQGILFILNNNGSQLVKSTKCFNNYNFKMKFNAVNHTLLLASFHSSFNNNIISSNDFSIFEISQDISSILKKYTVDWCNVYSNNKFVSEYYSNVDLNYDNQKNNPIICFTKKYNNPNPCNLFYLGPYYNTTYVYGILKLKPDFSLKSLHYIGTDKNQYFNSFTLDQQKNLVLAGYTPYNKYICTPGAYDPTHNGNNDLLIIKTDSCSVPFLNSSATTPQNICLGDSIHICQLNPANLNTFLWTGPNNFSLTSSNCLHFAPASPSLNGNYSFQYTDLMGCTLTATYSINVINAQSPTLQIITQPSPLCPSSIATIQPIPNNLYSYSWNVVSSNPNLTFVTTSPSFTFQTFNNSYYTINLVATNTAGCAGNATLSYQVSTPVINTNTTSFPYSLNLTNLSSNASYSFQWLDCNNSMQPIPGATLSTFTVTQNGSYAAAWAYGSCTGTTACHTVSTIDLDEFLSSSHQWILYPNPSYKGKFFVHASQDLDVEIMDVSGKILHHHFLIPKGTNEFNLNLPAGIYFIREKKNMLVRKWVVH